MLCNQLQRISILKNICQNKESVSLNFSALLDEFKDDRNVFYDCFYVKYFYIHLIPC